jgi:3-oxoacyl-[acyl-carrier protein] reductase
LDLELEGSRAIITGGTRGIGRAIAFKLAQEGCSIAICARDEAQVATTVAALRALGVNAYGNVVDVSQEAALERFIDQAISALGGLDSLVVNAGGAAGGNTLAEADAQAWRRSFDLNVIQAAVAARAAAPTLVAQGSGSIVFIASISGQHPQPMPQYASAKAAEIYLASSLARELGPNGVRVNSISPGAIIFPGGDWEQRRAADPQAFERWKDDSFPLGRLGTPDEVADVVCFILSARASWISGTDILVSGAQNRLLPNGY